MTTSNGTTTDYYTSNSYYVLLLTDITDSPCDQINITVSGYNGLNGEDELISIYLPKGYQRIIQKLFCIIIDICIIIIIIVYNDAIPIDVFIDHDWNTSISFNVSSFYYKSMHKI